MADIPVRVIRSYLATRETYERRRRYYRTDTVCAFATVQAQFAWTMAKIRLLRASGASPTLIKMAGEEMGTALHNLAYFRGRYPQLSDKSIRQEELTLGV